MHFKKLPEDENSLYNFFSDLTPRDPIKYLTTATIERYVSILLGNPQASVELMPFVYKEVQSQYLRSRLEDLFDAVLEAGTTKLIIIDNSPGDWGLSRATREIIESKKLRKGKQRAIDGEIWIGLKQACDVTKKPTTLARKR